MSEPIDAAYEKARTTYDAIVISHGAIGYRAGHYDAIRAAIDAVWPLAEIEGRRLAAVDIRAEDYEGYPQSLRPALEAARDALARIAEGTDHA
jgi:hypothetical protein